MLGFFRALSNNFGIDIASGTDISCVVANGTGVIQCIGTERFSYIWPPNTNFGQVEVGVGTLCGLKSEGNILCINDDSPDYGIHIFLCSRCSNWK